jgi:hypothetical protein
LIVHECREYWCFRIELLLLQRLCSSAAEPRAVALASGMEARNEDQRRGASRSRQHGPGGRRQTAAAGPGSTGTSPLPASGALPPKQKGRLCRSEAKASRQSRDQLKRHPQDGQHSAALAGPGTECLRRATQYRARERHNSDTTTSPPDLFTSSTTSQLRMADFVGIPSSISILRRLRPPEMKPHTLTAISELNSTGAVLATVHTALRRLATPIAIDPAARESWAD